MIFKKALFLIIFTTLIAPFILAPHYTTWSGSKTDFRIRNGKLIKVPKNQMRRAKKSKNCCFKRNKKGIIKAIRGTKAYRRFGHKLLQMKNGKPATIRVRKSLKSNAASIGDDAQLLRRQKKGKIGIRLRERRRRR